MTAAPADTCRIALASAAATDAFGLSVLIDGEDALATVMAAGPGILRVARRRGDPPFATSGTLLRRGDIACFLQQGALVWPVAMPEDGWLLATLADGSAVQHGATILRYVRAMESIAP